MSKKIRILIAEDDTGLKILIRKKLMAAGFEVKEMEKGYDLLKILPSFQPDLLLLDYKLADITAGEIIDQLKRSSINIPFMIITANGDEKIAVEMMKKGAIDYVIKDIHFLDLLPETVKKVAGSLEIEKKLKRTEKQLTISENNYMILARNIADVVWIVNLEMKFTYISPSVVKLLGYRAEELMGQSLEKLLTPGSFRDFCDVFSTLLKNDNAFNSAREVAQTFEYIMVSRDTEPLWTETRTSLLRNDEHNVVGVLGSTRDIRERKDAQARLQDSVARLYKALQDCIRSMGKMTEIRDPYTSGHQKRVASLGYAIARELGLPEKKQEFIRLVGSVHDIGKIAIPAEILSKPGKISANEYTLIKYHPQLGHDILKTVDFPWPLAEVVMQHHERLDGSGYPRGLKGEEIMEEARIIALADVVEAMASHRPYRASLGVSQALDEVNRFKGLYYDPDVVEACIRALEKDNTLL